MQNKIKLLTLYLLMGSFTFSGCQNMFTAKKTESNSINGKIHIDQIGYRPDARKVAIISDKGGKFDVVDAKTHKVVFTAETTGGNEDQSSGEKVYYADFSELKIPNKYYIRVENYGRSHTFEISNGIYKKVKNAMIKMLYYQRCGIKLDEKNAGKWSHDICHNTDAALYEETWKKINVNGGWHDAGDYGKYSVPGATTLGYLLLAYELFPNAFSEKLNIPESSNNIPDILNECRFELEWLLKMQDFKSGGVYHKAGTTYFPDFRMPEYDTGDLYIAPISAAATGDFAAVMAQAYIVYKKFDSNFADKCLQAANKAWEWLEKNPDVQGFTNPSGFTTGEYGDSNLTDERYWAAAQLYRATGEEKYHDYFKELFNNPKLDKTGLGWQNIGYLGTMSYLLTEKSKVDKDYYEKAKQVVINKADTTLAWMKMDGYHVPFGPEGYGWGSNMNVMNGAIYLICANTIKPNKEYEDYAEEQLHYLFGKNSLDQCFVTGFGSKTIKHPHHRPSESDSVDEPVPGMVSGGPNKYLQDDYAKKNLIGKPAAKCFADVMEAYSLNEVAIYWNAAAVFVAAYFDR